MFLFFRFSDNIWSHCFSGKLNPNHSYVTCHSPPLMTVLISKHYILTEVQYTANGKSMNLNLGCKVQISLLFCEHFSHICHDHRGYRTTSLLLLCMQGNITLSAWMNWRWVMGYILFTWFFIWLWAPSVLCCNELPAEARLRKSIRINTAETITKQVVVLLSYYKSSLTKCVFLILVRTLNKTQQTRGTEVG